MNESEKFIEFLHGYLFDRVELTNKDVKFIKDRLNEIGKKNLCDIEILDIIADGLIC